MKPDISKLSLADLGRMTQVDRRNFYECEPSTYAPTPTIKVEAGLSAVAFVATVETINTVTDIGVYRQQREEGRPDVQMPNQIPLAGA